MTEPLYIQYAKVVETSSTTNIKNRSNHLVPDKLGPHTRLHYINMCEVLSFSGDYGTAILYRVRVAEIYILSINKKSYIFDSNKCLYNFLTAHDIVKDSEDLKDEFKEYRFIDFFKISLLTHANVSERAGALVLFATDKDINFKYFHDNISFVARIPCIHEDKEVILAFLKTALVTNKVKEKLKKAHMQRINSAYNIPHEVIEELLETLDFNF